MKKLLALLLALIMVLSLAACGGKTDEPKGTDEPSASNNSSNGEGSKSGNSVSTLKIKDIKIGKTTYGDDGAFTLNVTVDWEGNPADDAWIGIIPADVEHGSEEKNDEFDVDYRYFKDLESGKEFSFENITLEPGDYTLRANESDAGGAELAWCGFTVSKLGKVKVDDSKVTILSNQPQNKEEENKDTNGGSVEIKDVNVDNWADVIEKNYGLELSLPDGCTISSAKTVNSINDVRIMFAPGGEEKYKAFGETLFAELLKDAESGIKNGLSQETYASFSEAYEKCGGIMALSVSVGGGKSLTIGYYDNGSSVELQLVRSGSWE